MTPRILVGLVSIPILVVLVWAGFPWLTILVCIAAVIGLGEFYQLTQTNRIRGSFAFGGLWIVLIIINGQLMSTWGNYSPHIVAAGVFLTIFWSICRREEHPVRGWLLQISGPLYIGLLLSHTLMLREGGDSLYNGRDWLFFALFVTFANDTGSFFIGTALGRHHMATTISPHKTWEGSMGGLLSAIGVAIATAAVFNLSADLWQQILLGIIIGSVAQIGDLIESSFKRYVGTKDTGRIIPGHGGILDRIDSLLLSIPVTYYILALIISH